MTAKQVTRTTPVARTGASVRQVNRRTAKVATAYTVPSTLFALIASMRPVSGPRLYAHTIASLEVLGITTATKASAPRLQALIGPRAFSYHTKVTHNLEVAGETVKLSSTGDEFFQAREEEGKAPRDLIDAFVTVFRTGKPSKTAEVKAHHISADPV